MQEEPLNQLSNTGRDNVSDLNFDIDPDIALDLETYGLDYQPYPEVLFPDIWDAPLPPGFTSASLAGLSAAKGGEEQDTTLVADYDDPRFAANLVLSANPFLPQYIPAAPASIPAQALDSHPPEAATGQQHHAHSPGPSSSRYPGAEYLDIPDSASTAVFQASAIDKGGSDERIKWTELDEDGIGEEGWRQAKVARPPGRPKGSKTKHRHLPSSKVHHSRSASSTSLEIPVDGIRKISSVLELRREVMLAAAGFCSTLATIMERTPAEVLQGAQNPQGVEAQFSTLDLISVVKTMQQACSSMIPTARPVSPASATATSPSPDAEAVPERTPTPEESRTSSITPSTPPTPAHPQILSVFRASPARLSLSNTSTVSHPSLPGTPQIVSSTAPSPSSCHGDDRKSSSPSTLMPASAVQLPAMALPVPTKISGNWDTREVIHLHNLVATSRQARLGTLGVTESGVEGVDWDWVVKHFGGGRTRHQVLIKAVELGLKGSSTARSRRVKQKGYQGVGRLPWKPSASVLETAAIVDAEAVD